MAARFSRTTTIVGKFLAAAVCVLACPYPIAAEPQFPPAHQQPLRPPPPPPPVIDPQPGPFVVRLDGRGQVEAGQRGVIANAARVWSGDALQAFTICFHSAQTRVDGNSVFPALDVVANELKARGAKAVVMPNGGLCEANGPKVAWQGSYVLIMGVIRL